MGLGNISFGFSYFLKRFLHLLLSSFTLDDIGQKT